MDTEVQSIMIVDDMQPNLRLLCDILDGSGYQLRPFTLPNAALNSALEVPPDLILLDVNMPELNGFEFCRRIHSDPTTSSIPVIFISAQKETAGILEGFRQGAVDYITKPFQEDEVHSRIQTHLKLRRAQRKLSEKNAALETTLNELKATQSQLVHAEKMASLGVLTAGIAHEINNPINFVKANAQIITKRIKEIKEGKRTFDETESNLWEEMAEGFLEGSSRIAEIVRSLETYARVGEEGKKLFDPKKNIDATLRMFSHRLNKSISIETSITPPLRPLYTNPGKINQVFTNLLSNAIAAVDENSQSEAKRIKITAKTEDDWYKIAVEDTGSGIDEEIVDKIFDPFFTTKPTGKGLGLGLSIASKLVEEQDGKLKVRNLHPGCVFEILLPNLPSNSQAKT